MNNTHCRSCGNILQPERVGVHSQCWYCQEHVAKCVQCGKEYTARRTPDGWYSYCSKDCEDKMEVVFETRRKIARGEL